MDLIDYYLSLSYKLESIPDLDEGGFTASYPDLKECLTTGETLESVIQNARYAKKVWLETALVEGLSIPQPDSFRK